MVDVHDRVELELGCHVDDTFQAVNFHVIHKDLQIPVLGNQNAHLASNTKVGRVPLNFLLNLIGKCAFCPISNEAGVFQFPSHVRELFQLAWRTLGHADGQASVQKSRCIWLVLQRGSAFKSTLQNHPDASLGIGELPKTKALFPITSTLVASIRSSDNLMLVPDPTRDRKPSVLWLRLVSLADGSEASAYQFAYLALFY